ncbi:MAG: Ig-like domain-containing protein [Limisphaerales bacterium]
MKLTTRFGLFALIGIVLFGALVVDAAPTPLDINTVPGTVNITDKQSTNLFDPVTVTDSATNVVSVLISFSPTSLGGFQTPLPTGVVHSNNFYVIDVTNVSTANTLLGQLTFTPINNLIPVPNISNVVFQISATDASGNSAAAQSTTLRITSTNDTPTLTVSGTTNFAITDKQTVQPLGAISFNDVDNSGNQPVIVTVSLDDTNKGAIVVGSTGFTLNANGTATITNTDSAATTALAALVFTPSENDVPVGQTETTTFTVRVSDGYAAVSNSTITVTATSVNDAPIISGVTTAHQTVQTGHTLSPFSILTLLDVDPNDNLAMTNGQTLSYQVVLSGPSPLGTLELGGFSGTNYSSSGDPKVATSDLRNVIYRAPSSPIAGTNTLTVTISANDGHGGSLSTNIYIDLYSLISPPGLSGTASGQRVNDNTSIALFSSVTIKSFNGNSMIVKVGLSGVTDETQGTIANLSGFVKNTSVSPPTYDFGGTSEAATTAIRALVFQPTPNRINGSSTDTVVFGITLVDGPITNTTDTSTTVIVTPVNDNPTLIGVSPLVTIQDTQTVPPFSTVLISDADELGVQPLTVTVTLDTSAKGIFSTNSLVLSGFTSNNGVYTLTRTTNASAAIRQLVFVPTPNRVPVGLTETTTFTIRVDDSHGGIVQNSSTQVRVAAVSGVPIVTLPSPQPVSIPLTSNIFPFQLVTIADATVVNVGVQITTPTQGTFTPGSVSAAGFLDRGSGVYTFNGSASNATTAIEQLNFSPGVGLLIGQPVNFAISVTNQIPNSIQTNLAIVLRKTQNSYIVTTTADYDPTDANVPDSAKKGTLRKAIADAGNNDHVTFDIRSTIAGTPDYPATIHLLATLVLNNTLTFDGPGADSLTISGDSASDGVAKVQLFAVTNGAIVQMNRLKFTKGHDSFAGGAFEVATGSTLNLSYCAVTDCSADVWGGGIDVTEGTLNIDHCLIAGNSTSSSVGQGGGGISIYADQSCTIANTTFATNRQNAVTGLGGGGLYVENVEPGVELDVFVVNCTFHDNRDASNQGTSIRPNVFNTYVQLQNSIVADGQGNNLEMDDSGTILSLGGNLSDDSTTTTFSTGGSATNTIIFHPPTDFVNTNPQLLGLANNGGPTSTFALGGGSAAVSNAVSAGAVLDALGTDQRGFFRDNKPDIGAYDLGASRRIIVEEFAFNPAAPNTNDEFIEFYVPRDSTALNLAGFKLYVGGVLRHTFTSRPMSPGEALVLFSHDAVNTAVPPGVYKQICATNLLLDNAAGTFTLKNSSDQTILQISYVSSFVTSAANDPGYLSASNQSLVLSPQFQGIYLPYQRVVAKEGGRIPGASELSNPGYDAAGNPLAIGNFPPRAYDDSAATDAQTPIGAIPVLANDVDLDATDTIRVVGVGVTNGITPGVTGTTNYSALGAQLIINNSPTTGATIKYDPTTSAFLTSLPQGSNVVDTFQYTILDSAAGVDHTRGADLAATNQNLLKATATVTVNVTGVNQPPVPTDDSVLTNPILTTAEDAVLDFTTADNLLGNDRDPNTDDTTNTLRIVSIEPTSAYIAGSLQITTALGATVTLDIRFDRNQTHITYDPRGSAVLNALAQGQTAVDTFYYTVMDRYNTVGTAAINITVAGVNDAPTANADYVATDEDTPLNIAHSQLLANDTDPDNGTILQVTSVTPTSALGASVTIFGTNVVYDPRVSATLNALARKEVVIDTFTYTASDDHGLSSNAVVSVTVTGVNDRPISAPDAYSTGEKSLLRISSPGVLANDTDPDINNVAPDDTLNVLAGSGVSSAGAPVTISTDGSFSYDPRGLFNWLHEGQTTSDTFSYVVLDHSLTVANNDSFTVQAGTSSNLLSVIANDANLANNGGVLTITSVSAPNQNGSVAINSNGTGIYYSPPQNFAGTESFTYTIADGQGGSDTATVTVGVSALTIGANADAFTVARGTSVNLDVLANDSTVPVTSGLTITGLGMPNKRGTITLNGTGANNQIHYTPADTNAYPYFETFTYQVAVGGSVATGSVTVTVIDRSSTLTANDDTFTALAGTGTAVFDVLANDQVVPGTTTNLVITGIQTNGIIGTLSINGTQNKLVYRPPAGVTNHQEPFVTYTISDGAGGTATGNVSIKVISSGFFANDDVFTVVQGSTGNTLPVMVNDGILPNLGQSLLISAIGIGTNAPQHGTVSINGAGKAVIYTPTGNFSGEDSFSYEISDGSPNRAVGHVKVKVINTSVVNSNPDFYSVAHDSTATVLQLLKNDYVLPITPGTLKITALQTNGLIGTASINGSSINNSITYTPAPGFIGLESFGYTTVDGNGDTGSNTVTLSVGSLITGPDTFTVLAGSVSNSLDVLVNDHILPDTAGRPLSGFGSATQGGTISADASRSHVLYTPAPGFTGFEQFTYQVTNDTGAVVSGTATVNVVTPGSDRDTNTVTITIVGVNDVPTITGTQGGFSITDKQTASPFGAVTIGDVDDYGLQTLTVTITLDNASKGRLVNLGGFLNVAPGTYTLQSTGPAITAAIRGLVFVPTPNRISVPTTEATTITITANDGFVASPVVDANTIVNVTAADDAPTITGTLSNQKVYDHSTLAPFAAVTIADVDDLGAQPLAVTVTLDLPTHGFLTSLGNFVSTGSGIYTINNVTAAQATSALRALIFVPTISGRLAPGASETNRLTISVADGYALPTVDNNTTVISTDAFTKESTNGNGTTATTFAYSVAASRDYVVAGMPHDLVGSIRSGSAYIYSRNAAGTNTWTQVKKLVGTGTQTVTDQFGLAVAISGDTVAVGALWTGTGAAYVFDRNQGGSNNWGFSKKFTAADGGNLDLFGTVAIDGDTLVVGASRNAALGTTAKTGAAYVYSRNQGGLGNWGLVKKLIPTDGTDGDEFGYSISISSNTIAIGSHLNSLSNNAVHAGTVYLFDRNQGGTNNWGLVRKIGASDGVTGDLLGHSVSLSGDLLVAGAPFALVGVKSGAVYAFSRNQGGSNVWGQVRKFTHPEGATSTQFGNSVALDGELIAIGTFQDASQQGAVFHYARNFPGLPQWSLLEKILPPTNDTYAAFGYDVALKDGTLAAGARYDDGTGARFGVTYIYEVKFDNTYLAHPIADQWATAGLPFNFTIPSDAFADTDFDSLTFSLASIPVAPGWVAFNTATATLSGTPSAVGSYPVAINAMDPDGVLRTSQFNINVAPPMGVLAPTWQGSTVNFVLSCAPGYTYRLQRTSSLDEANTIWSDVAVSTAATNASGVGVVFLSDTGSSSSAFYRVVVQ